MPSKLLMLGAMYENGGNTTHRFLDGHRQLAVYPFESQLGTRLVVDALSSLFPVKYRWPVFHLESTLENDYRGIIDEECKVRARTPKVSKFRHMPFEFSDEERCARFCSRMAQQPRTRANLVMAFFEATFAAWHDHKGPAAPAFYVGYSPILVVDAEQILTEVPDAHFLHIVRNPWSAYAATKKRPVPLALKHYVDSWVLNQHFALQVQQIFPDRLHILRLEDTLADPVGVLGEFCRKLGLDPDPCLQTPSWNGVPLEAVYPWGTIRAATPEANRATAEELSPQEREQVALRAQPYLEQLHYADFL